MYFLLLMLKNGRKRSALQPQTIYSEVPYVYFRFTHRVGQAAFYRFLTPSSFQSFHIQRSRDAVISEEDFRFDMFCYIFIF